MGNPVQLRKSFLKRLAPSIAFGPGIFPLVILLDGSVSLHDRLLDSTYWMQLLLGFAISWYSPESWWFAYGNFAAGYGRNSLDAFKEAPEIWKAIAIMIIIGISFGQWNSLMGF